MIIYKHRAAAEPGSIWSITIFILYFSQNIYILYKVTGLLVLQVTAAAWLLLTFI